MNARRAHRLEEQVLVRAARGRSARAAPRGRGGPPCAARAATRGRRTSGRCRARSCPTFAPARRASFARSRATWYGMITCALRLTRTLRVSMPFAASMSSSRDERRRVDDDAVADHRRDVRVEHARRAQLELHGLVADHDRVARVVAALVADDHRDLLGEEVGRLALALVAPLEADDHRRGHQRAPDMKRPRPNVPGSWIDISRVRSPVGRQAGGSKVRGRLTGRTTRLPRAMVSSSIAGQAPRSRSRTGVSIPNPGRRRIAAGAAPAVVAVRASARQGAR